MREQFLWASLQAGEKIFEGNPDSLAKKRSFLRWRKLEEAKKKRLEFGHDLLKLLATVKEISDLPLGKPE